MPLTVELRVSDSETRACRIRPDARYVVAQGHCPASGCHAGLYGVEFRVFGRGRRDTSDDQTLCEDAWCELCGARVGTIAVHGLTLFGFAEDERVLHGAPRVY